ncbi:MAG: hypothetical protein AAF985_27645, partial [Bacteroidota bacterium]
MKQSNFSILKFINLLFLLAFFATSTMALDTGGNFFDLQTRYNKAGYQCIDLQLVLNATSEKWPVESPAGKWTKMPGSNVKVIAGGGTKVMMINNSNDL